jgi:DNA-binding response OmpR family regulator
LPILVVDDDELIREVVTETLEMAGYRVLTACDGVQALAVAEREQPSLVLLDVRMPLLDGWAVAERLAQSAKSPPIVVVSASHGSCATARHMGLGYLPKPFDYRALLAVVAEYLAAGDEREPAAPSATPSTKSRSCNRSTRTQAGQ